MDSKTALLCDLIVGYGNSIFSVSLYVDVLYDEETVFYIGGNFKASLEHYQKKPELSRQ